MKIVLVQIMANLQAADELKNCIIKNPSCMFWLLEQDLSPFGPHLQPLRLLHSTSNCLRQCYLQCPLKALLLQLSFLQTRIHTTQATYPKLTSQNLTRTSSKHHHITHDLKSLHWLNVQERIHFKVLSLTYNSLQHLHTNYLHKPSIQPAQLDHSPVSVFLGPWSQHISSSPNVCIHHIFGMICHLNSALILLLHNNSNNNNFRVSNIRVSNRALIYNVCPKSALT